MLEANFTSPTQKKELLVACKFLPGFESLDGWIRNQDVTGNLVATMDAPIHPLISNGESWYGPDGKRG